ncbi:Cytochrome P450 monooxygenase PikC [Streptomyces sp. RB17]|nr:Cytochrome P450 monooxygenase PikC [Streptomyces sp. RB17]
MVPQADGSYLIGGYHQIAALLHDPRMSADPRTRGEVTRKPPFLRLDDPEHHRLRTLAMRPFGPPHSPGRVDGMRGEIDRITKELLEPFEAGRQVDIVDDFAYPLPVTVICRLLGVPREDEPLFRAWSDAIVAAADVRPDDDSTEPDKAGDQARMEMGGYLLNLAEQRRGKPGDDMLSAFVNEPDPALRLTDEELAETAVLLLIAGHETTVNLITNGALTTLVPAGASVVLVLASGNRDPMRFRDPDRFDPARPDNQHLGFGSGIHACYGGPLARVEAYAALGALLPHLGSARLVEDPPPYRQNAMLRGPRHLPIHL